MHKDLFTDLFLSFDSRSRSKKQSDYVPDVALEELLHKREERTRRTERKKLFFFLKRTERERQRTSLEHIRMRR